MDSTTLSEENASTASGDCTDTRVDSESLNMVTCQLILRNSSSLKLTEAPEGFVYANSVVGVDVSWKVDNEEEFTCSQLAQGTKLFCFAISAFALADDFGISLSLVSESSGGVFENSISTTEILYSGSSAAPNTPEDLTLSVQSSTGINISWNPRSENETFFLISRSTDGTTFSPIENAAAGVNTYSDTELSPSTAYYYKVQACNEIGCSSSPETVTATTSVAILTDTWSAVSTTGTPSARYAHSAIWSGTEMIVWGGGPTGSSVNTGGRFNPTTNTWTSTTTTSAPTARTLHSAVWTGSKMIIWGGVNTFGGSTYYNTGGIYDPATDSWSAMTTTGAPTARKWHMAVWTGSKMIVWGGYAGAYLNSGGVYDPDTNTWTSTTTTGAPSSRAIGINTGEFGRWTGSKMIVWGGFPRNSTGALYDPTLNSWTTMTTTGALAGRTSISPVWTGSAYVFWGGDDGGSAMNDGAMYTPSTDSWVTISTTGAPAAVQNNRSVWTGSKMLSWGGEDGSSTEFDTGTIFDPSTNTWDSTTSTTGAPSARFHHTAVWTGSSMVVWGGTDGSALSTGAIYK